MGLVGPTRATRYGGKIDNSSSLAHLGSGKLHRKENSLEIQGQDGIPFRLSNFKKWSDKYAASIVYQHSNLPPFGSKINYLLNFIYLGQISVYSQDTCPQRLYLFFDLIQGRRVYICDCNRKPISSQATGDSSANSLASTSDYSNLCLGGIIRHDLHPCEILRYP